jgi:hypothetical protein
MALDYSLTIQNTRDEIEPDQIRESLMCAFPLQNNPLSDLLVASGLSVNVFKEDDEDEESIFGAPFPDVCVAFRIDKFEHSEKGITTMLKIAIWLMSFFDEDMILFFDSEDVIFQRISGQLILNGAPEFWTESRLALLKQRYQIEKFASL